MTVTPGGVATTTLTVRNDSDIVEAYTLEVVGECAAWSTVEPARVSLYPGTSEEVTIRLAPPRSYEVRAGETPLAVRVLPAEHPEAVAVPETTVIVEAFREPRAELEPRRRRGWLGARYRVAVRNLGNTPVDVVFAGSQAGEELRLAFTPVRRRLVPGESADAGLRVRTRKLIWFGAPTTWSFEVAVDTVVPVAPVLAADGAGVDASARPGVVADAGTVPVPAEAGGPAVAVASVPSEQPLGQPVLLPGEFVQLPVLPKWLLILLAALLALLVAWFALVRPSVRSTAKQAGTKAAEKEVARDAGKQQDALGTAGPTTGQTGGRGTGTGESAAPAAGGSKPGGSGGGTGTGGGGGGQSSATIDVQTGGVGEQVGTYRVPDKSVFAITDLVVSNFQGDEGLVTISFGEQKITTIALETFRNQDYHWVTPIQIPANGTVTASVTCAKPGTPATGQQAVGCHEVLNVSGVLSRTD
ncbi:hypothetical protein EHYA_05411 [Embleya hyalina]|uniref:Hydrolytic protein n=1 Tax=Embleya hyalina TaxID=516124 RepID=A0A401YT48_9ACTN|nr:hypothetical protein EHYA_05411 [Embleya hyalina]